MKILITSVRTGCGHVRAAEAIREALRRTAPEIETLHIDATDYAAPAFRRLYLDGYRFAVNRAPSLWGRLYHFWDRRQPESKLTPIFCRAQRSFVSRFFGCVRNFKPDLIVTTHFLIPQLMAIAPDEALRSIPLECVITDYSIHPFWISRNISRYYVAHEGLVKALAARGIPNERISVTGIPVHPAFTDAVNLAALYRKFHLDPVRPVLVMLTGGLGLASLEKAVNRILTLPGAFQVVTISGNNAELRERLNRITPPPAMTLHNLGYVDNMHELLSVSDIVITKPGGLTVSECLAKKKLMILISPIPGQEERNARFLASQHAALRAPAFEDLPSIVLLTMSEPLLRQELGKNITRCSRPKAAFAIAENIISHSMVA